MPNLPADVALRLSALLAALTAITAEDITAIRQQETLGENIAANIESFQEDVKDLDEQTISILNQAREASGLPSI